MSLIRWTPMFPWDDFDKMFEDLHPVKKGQGMQGFMPAVDVYDKKNEVVVEMSLPHVEPEKVDIFIEDNVLHVKGSTEKKTEVEDKSYYRREISAGSFYRAIPLPTEVVVAKTSAVHEDGVLKISMPKATPKKEDNKITVKVIKKKEKKDK